MTRVFDSIKGRIFLVLLVFLSLSHLLGLWLYAARSEVTTTLLHDALLAERIALISRLVNVTPLSERASLLELVSGPLAGFSRSADASLGEVLPEGSRPHLFEHLLDVFSDRPIHDGIRVAYAAGGGDDGLKGLLAIANGPIKTDIDHLPAQPLAEIHPAGSVTAEIKLGDGSWLRVAAPLLNVRPFSPWKLGAALGAMLVSVLFASTWVVSRWTQPLTYFSAAAERLGLDIHAPALAETGPFEIRTAAHAFNLMQDRIRRLVQDRVAFAAAIAHDLGTPITRLHLRAEEIPDEEVRKPILADLEQMRRMIMATLGFARLDFSEETSESFDLMTLVHRVSDDLIDLGHEAAVKGPAHIVVRSKPVTLRRALSNVVENAVKYGARAYIEVVESGDAIKITVDDDGPGIPEALQSDVFEPFRRLTAPGDKVVEGTGLGLTAARSLIRGLGGDIGLRNRREGGLRVSICLPTQADSVLKPKAHRGL